MVPVVLFLNHFKNGAEVSLKVFYRDVFREEMFKEKIEKDGRFSPILLARLHPL